MFSFSTFLNEKLIVFNGKAYPKFGTVVILAGGAGSGKGFQLENLIGVEGKVMDVDALKLMAIKSTQFAKKVKDETGHDLKTFDLKNPENTFKIHDIVSSMYNIPNKKEQALFASVLTAAPDRKPNLIFDVTLKNMSKLTSITRDVLAMGYEKKNIHLVWVVNAIHVATRQNAERSRVVPSEILMDTHEGAALTMKKILDMGDTLRQYMDGDIWLTFNSVDNNDTRVQKSGSGGSYVSKANYVRVKKTGQAQTSTDELGSYLVGKIKSYVPDTKTW